MNGPKVTVIIPVFNLEKWIEKCIQSVLEQTIDNIEIIAIDDGSKDKSYQLLLRMQEQYPQKLTVLTQKNSGQAVARNKALNMANGEYIVFVDGDDYIAKDYLQQMVDKADAEQLDCVVCGYDRVDSDGNILLHVVPDASNELFQMKYLAVCSKLIRKSYINQNGIRFPEGKLYEDVSFSWQVLFLTQKVEAIEYTGYKYLFREGSSSNQVIDAKRLPLEENRAIIRKILSKIEFSKRELFEYSVLAQYTYLIFVLARKNPTIIIRVLSKEIRKLVKEFFPQYYKNRYLYAKVTRHTLPKSQTWGVGLLVFLLRTKSLPFVASILTRV